ncbi:hypothetical protein Bpfe_016600 [Biomphalaria pfeifferi]|uniref:Uncharacterized protein n=1 Tax=Biomphalaria pfeifferi TaxID=112525 RepID=A0AAD8F827_BIOPF|nr:hypothetical protein Bpfe_016600 [Biomphalaria pfeifferi]
MAGFQMLWLINHTSKYCCTSKGSSLSAISRKGIAALDSNKSRGYYSISPLFLYSWTWRVLHSCGSHLIYAGSQHQTQRE